MTIDLDAFAAVQAEPFIGKRVSTDNYTPIEKGVKKSAMRVYYASMMLTKQEFTSKDIDGVLHIGLQKISNRLTDLKRDYGMMQIARIDGKRPHEIRVFRRSRPDEIAEFMRNKEAMK